MWSRKQRVASQVENLLDFYFVGVSLGLAYAHPHSGDTVASVMIGGLRTVLNGAFQVHTNDLLMFYWDSEVALFEDDGSRHPRNILQTSNQKAQFLTTGKIEKNGNGVALTRSDIERRSYYARGNGTYNTGVGGPVQGKINVARIKPYIASKHYAGAQHEHFPMDKTRVFGKAISNAQPYEMVDIMLSRQAI